MNRTCLVFVSLAVAAAAVFGAGCSSDKDDSTATTVTAWDDTTTSTEEGATTTASATSAPGGSSSSTAPTATAPPATAAPTTAAPSAGTVDLDKAMATFKELRKTACTMADTPEPVRIDATPDNDPNLAIVTDDMRYSLVVDVSKRVVYSVEGPDAELPGQYSFGCDPHVFLGTLSH